ncbi:hemerythrin domain-containing protein [Streptomyces sp. enrichment culture]|uniref:hemerythrin domain-containing protein n=1 Tax=Streptomyces sp. enrichment culture TaxID=1795815 RepID=UPI003F5676DB
MGGEAVEHRLVPEMLLLNKAQRFATTLLIDAVQRGPAPLNRLAEFRCFLVGALRHYHDQQEAVLWPQLISAVPAEVIWLIDLSAQHDALESALDALDSVPLYDPGGRRELAAAAAALRGVVHTHLDDEESRLLPALTTHVPDEFWTEFFRSMLASLPRASAHLGLALLETLGTPAEFALFTANLPHSTLGSVPAMRERAMKVLRSLRPADR